MTLGAEIAARLPQLRTVAESMMADTCTITRPSGPPVFDATTGQYNDPPAPITVYSGKCRIRTRGKFLRNSEAVAGDALVVLWPYIVAIPADAPRVDVLDVVTITGSRDEALVDAEMRVRITSLATDQTARRLDCEEIA